MPETKEASEQKWPPEQIWLPTGVVMLAAVSPELENVEGAYWVRKDVADAAVEQAVARTWEKAIRVAQLSTKKSLTAGLNGAAAEILIRRLEAAAKEKRDE